MWRHTGIFMALALVISGCSSSLGEDAPDIERDQKVAEGTSTGDTPANGPGPGVLTEAWRATGPDLPADDPNPDLRVAGGQLLFGTNQRIDTYDVRTGRKRWHYSEPGRRLSYAVDGDAVVVDSSPTGREPAPVTTGLDLATGELLWERAFDSAEPASPMVLDGTSGDPGAADGIVPLFAPGEEDEDPGELIALDSATGEETWRREFASAVDCDSPSRYAASDTDGSVLVFWESCTSEDVAAVHAFDPATGRPLWSRSGGTRFGAQVSVRNGATLIVLDENTRALVGRDGKDVADLRGIGRCDSDCTLVAAGDGVAVRQGVTGMATATLVGKDRARAAFAAQDGQTYAIAGGARVYALRRAHGDRLPPSGLLMADPATGRVSQVPMPVSVIPDAKAPLWMGTAGDLLLLAQGRQVTAYRSTRAAGPVELGGVPAKEWPKACPLLDDLEKVKKRREDTEPVKVGATTLDRPRCTFSYEGPDYTEEARVRIAWVAPDARRAAPLLTGEAVEGADAVRREQFQDTALVRTGRYIVEVEARDGDLDEIIASVVKGLR